MNTPTPTQQGQEGHHRGTRPKNSSHEEKAKILSGGSAPSVPLCPCQHSDTEPFATWLIYPAATQKPLKDSPSALARLRSQGVTLTLHSDGVIGATGPVSWFTDENLDALGTRASALAAIPTLPGGS